MVEPVTTTVTIASALIGFVKSDSFKDFAGALARGAANGLAKGFMENKVKEWSKSQKSSSGIVQQTKEQAQWIQAQSEYLKRREEREKRALEFKHEELQLQQQDLEDRRELARLQRELMRELHAEAVEVKLTEIQTIWDLKNWPSKLNREDTKDILRNGQQQYRLLMLASPPKISKGCPESFYNYLEMEIQSSLETFLDRYYPLNPEADGFSPCPVEFYEDYFKEPISGRTQLKQLHGVLAPVPTVVLYSRIVNDEVHFRMGHWGLYRDEVSPVSMQPWNWKQAWQELEKAGVDKDDSLLIIRQIIVMIHKLSAAFVTDLYYLYIDATASYEPRLFEFEEEFEQEWFPQELLRDYIEMLREVQQRQRDVYEAEAKLLRCTWFDKDEYQIIQSDPSGFPRVYKLPLKKEMKDTQRMISKCHIGQPIFPRPSEKVLMVVGATGTGKSTLINGMVNYILGVDWKDNFRFRLIIDEGGKSQAHSQTKWITAYTIHKMEDSPLPYTLTIVDTPGFGDTGGLKRDEFITNQIREFFSMPNGISHIDGIGFVTQSTQAWLTPKQQYIFDAILSIFGKDIANNIFMMVTFADGHKPTVLEAIKEAKVPYSSYFKFNNLALFAENVINEDDEDVNFDEMFWKMGFKSFKEFFTEFQKKDSISLQMTKDVLTERQQLEATVNGLLPQIREVQLKFDEFLREEAVLIQNKEAIRCKTKVKDVINSLNAELEEVCMEIFLTIQKVQKCLRRLDEIALKPNRLTQAQYIDLLIESEKKEAKFGWQDRVKYYQSAREFAATLAQTKDAASIERKGDIKAWAKELISKLKNDKMQQIESGLKKSR